MHGFHCSYARTQKFFSFIEWGVQGLWTLSVYINFSVGTSFFVTPFVNLFIVSLFCTHGWEVQMGFMQPISFHFSWAVYVSCLSSIALLRRCIVFHWDLAKLFVWLRSSDGISALVSAVFFIQTSLFRLLREGTNQVFRSFFIHIILRSEHVLSFFYFPGYRFIISIIVKSQVIQSLQLVTVKV